MNKYLFYLHREEKQSQRTEEKEGKDWQYFMTTFILGVAIVVLHVL